MAEMISTEDIENVKTDLGKIAEAVNTETVVVPRFGNPFDSLPLAIRKIMETGGFEPFLTEELLLASSPTVSPKAAKALDTKKVWYWDGVWHDTGLSELDQANINSSNLVNLLAEKVISLLFSSPSTNNLFQFSDSDGNLIYRIDKDAKHWIVGLEQDMASSILSNNQLVDSLSNAVISKLTSLVDNQLLTVQDAEGNIAYRIDTDSKHWIVGLDTDVATAINRKSEKGLEAKDTSNLGEYSYRDTFIAKAERLLNFFRNTQDTGLLAPVPLQSFEQNFSIGTGWLNEAKITEWGSYIPVDTPYGQDRGVVHPQILEVPNKFMGYRYILTITGYTNGVTTEENPFLLASNDLQSFDLITPILNEPPSYEWEHGVVYNNDPFTFYDHKTGELVLIFRRYYSSSTSGVSPYMILLAITTKDGNTWSEPIEFYNSNLGDLQILAPCLFFDVKSETYHMYGVNQSTIRHFTTKNWRGDWVQQADVTTPVGDAPWHADLKLVGDKLLMTYQNRVSDTSVGFKLGISSDYQNFIWADDWWNSQDYEVYKATFLPQFNEQNQMRLVFIWTTNHKPVVNLRYKLFVKSTPYFDVEFLEK